MIEIPRHIWIAASTWVSKLVIICIQFYSIRILIDILGLDGYALFTVALSLMGWFLLLDFGVGSSLQNKISVVRGVGGNHNSYFFIIISILLAILLIILCAIIWLAEPIASTLFEKFIFLAAEHKIYTVKAFFILFVMNAFSQIVIKVLFAEQKGWISNLALGVGAIVSLGCLIFLKEMPRSSNDLLYSIYSYQLPTIIIILSVLVWKLFSIKKEIIFSKSAFLESIEIIKKGGGFFLFSLLSACVLQADYLVLSQKVVGDQLVIYSVFSRIFAIVLFFYSALLQASWPVCSENHAKGHYHIYKSIQKKYFGFGGAFVLMCGLVIWFCKDIVIGLFAPGKSLEVSAGFIILLLLYQIVRIWTDTYAMFLQSAGVLKPLWIMIPAQAIISVTFQWYGAEYFGLNGLIIGLILSFLLTVTWWLPYSFKKTVLNQ